MGRPSRIEFLDVLKGVAVLLMVQVHCYGWWLTQPHRAEIFFTISVVLGWFAAPIFLFAVGCGMVISRERRLNRGETEWDVAIHVFLRACGLFVGGYLLNYVTFSGTPRSDLQSVGVLSCIGMCLVVGYVAARWLPRFAAAILALICVLLTPILWQSMPQDAALQHWLVNVPYQSNYALLPWSAYALMGVEVGNFLLSASGRPEKLRKQFRLLFAIGIALVCLWGTRVLECDSTLRQAALSSAARMQALFWYPSASFLLFHAGFVLVEFAITGWLLHLHGWGKKLWRPLSLSGQAALLLFVGHYLLGYRLVYTLTEMEGVYGTMSVGEATICLCFMLAACWILTEIWVRRRPT